MKYSPRGYEENKYVFLVCTDDLYKSSRSRGQSVLYLWKPDMSWSMREHMTFWWEALKKMHFYCRKHFPAQQHNRCTAKLLHLLSSCIILVRCRLWSAEALLAAFGGNIIHVASGSNPRASADQLLIGNTCYVIRAQLWSQPADETDNPHAWKDASLDDKILIT